MRRLVLLSPSPPDDVSVSSVVTTDATVRCCRRYPYRPCRGNMPATGQLLTFRSSSHVVEQGVGQEGVDARVRRHPIDQGLWPYLCRISHPIAFGPRD